MELSNTRTLAIKQRLVHLLIPCSGPPAALASTEEYSPASAVSCLPEHFKVTLDRSSHAKQKPCYALDVLSPQMLSESFVVQEC